MQVFFRFLLLATSMLFVYSLFSSNILWTLLALGLGIFLQKQELFKEYDEKRAKRYQEYQQERNERQKEGR